jgi:hypothetical protein
MNDSKERFVRETIGRVYLDSHLYTSLLDYFMAYP